MEIDFSIFCVFVKINFLCTVKKNFFFIEQHHLGIFDQQVLGDKSRLATSFLLPV